MQTKYLVAVVLIVAALLGIIAYVAFAVRGRPAMDAESARPAAETPANGEPATLGEAAIEADIVGTWRSRDDAKFTRVFTEDGAVIDRYEGDADATVTGSWTTVTDTDGLPFEADRDMTVLQVAFPEERLFFGVTELTPTSLEMLYLGGNGILRFERI
ncbi:MAG TPA: hypothetical protein VHO23_03050 [Candidatus Paceibacterota bacterium]|nr:hypothetical protein [Candidatus Paceibacterota bacterium]